MSSKDDSPHRHDAFRLDFDETCVRRRLPIYGVLPMRSMTVNEDGDSLVVVFSDRHINDEVRIMEIGDDLTEIASKMAAGQGLVLDFQNVDYFSSAMVGQIVQVRIATERKGVEMRLRNVSPTILAILRVMHLDKVFRVENPDA